MRILAFGDIHGDSSLAKKLAEKAEKENVELVVLCGDITFAGQETKDIIKPFIDKDKKVILIPGNHESVATADFFAEFYGATNLHGYSIRNNDVGFFGCGGANVGMFQTSEEDFFNLLKKGNDYLKDVKKKIMVTHVHPSNTKMDFAGMFPGSVGIRKAIEQFKPDLLLCGHVHEADGIEDRIGNTRIINVGKKGKIIEV